MLAAERLALAGAHFELARQHLLPGTCLLQGPGERLLEADPGRPRALDVRGQAVFAAKLQHLLRLGNATNQ